MHIAHTTNLVPSSEFKIKIVSMFGFCQFFFVCSSAVSAPFASLSGISATLFFVLFLVGYHIVVVSQLFYSHPYKYLGSALAGLVCLGITAAAGIIEAMTSQPANVDVFVCSGNGWLNWYCRCRFNVCVPLVAGIRKPCVDVSVIGGGGGDCDWNVNAVRSPDGIPRVVVMLLSSMGSAKKKKTKTSKNEIAKTN